MRWYDPLLYPLSLCYDVVTKVRNRMFDVGIKKSHNFDHPSIVVGNLNVGGSGKTPMVEFLVEEFAKMFNLVVLSRGYGRKTSGFLMVNENLGPLEVGDEPFQIFSKFREKIKVAVGEKRVPAVTGILRNHPETNLILLDDAFQHRYLRADFYILLTTYQNPFFEDQVLPLGRLRESKMGARRANVVVVTKCPSDLEASERKSYTDRIAEFTPAKTIFSTIQYGEPISVLENGSSVKSKAILVSGIANESLFVRECERRFEVVEKISYGDHHDYKVSEIKYIRDLIRLHKDCMVITTEKDAVKLKNPSFHDYLAEIPIFALPIKIKMTEKDQMYLLGQISNMIAEKAYRL